MAPKRDSGWESKLRVILRSDLNDLLGFYLQLIAINKVF